MTRDEYRSNKMSKFHTRLLLALALTAAGAAPAMAQANGTDWLNRMERMRPVQANSQQPWVSAQVKSANLRSGKITVTHAAIGNIGMPAMTMTVGVAPAHFAAVKKGDQISIQLAKRGAWQVVSYRPGY
jgi:Cu/Ag efflux protein CusF